MALRRPLSVVMPEVLPATPYCEITEVVIPRVGKFRSPVVSEVVKLTGADGIVDGRPVE